MISTLVVCADYDFCLATPAQVQAIDLSADISASSARTLLSAMRVAVWALAEEIMEDERHPRITAVEVAEIDALLAAVK